MLLQVWRGGSLKVQMNADRTSTLALAIAGAVLAGVCLVLGGITAAEIAAGVDQTAASAFPTAPAPDRLFAGLWTLGATMLAGLIVLLASLGMVSKRRRRAA
jgi:uncharacterized membrane protein YhaH (DUF805 family)